MSRRGAILLEMLVALAVLVLAASILLSTFGDVDASIERDRVTARAADLARTRMSEIEAGLISAEDLRASGPPRASDSSSAPGGASGGGPSNGVAAQDEFSVDAALSRSAFDGLTVVELRVFHARAEQPVFVLRQLVALPESRRDAELSP